MDEETARILHVKPGQKMCTNCVQRLKDNPVDDEQDTTMNVDYALPPSEQIETLKDNVLSLGCSPLKSVSKRDKRRYGKRKARDMASAAKCNVAKALHLESNELSSTESECCVKCQDQERLIDLLKQKCMVSSRQEKLKLLTLAPASWSIKRTANEFQVTKHLVKKSRALKKSKGILADPISRKGKTLDSDIKDRVVALYQSDEYSRICPGKKDYVSVKVNGVKEQRQKRLLLVNVKELHIEYLKETGDKIGFSTFAELRPKWCVPVSSTGMHSVCVCEIHQNVKLLVCAIPGQCTYKELMGKVVCNIDNRNCMLHLCDNCPGKEALSEYLLQLFSDNDVDHDDMISYKQWLHTDRTTLVSIQQLMPEFVETACNAIHGLRPHHFINKSQSSYLKSLKQNIPENQVIILSDFAENYSFVVQDAVQGHHWDNSQATLHPFAVYHNDSGKVKCLSMCVISDCLRHDTTTVHAFVSNVLAHLKKELPNITKVIYFSDGAASQYKNYKNFSNVCNHENDHGLKAEWHFFATSHGKSPCDGIGGTVKRLVARASLQATVDNHILTARDMFKWSEEHIRGITFLFVTADDVQENTTRFGLEDRYSSAKKIPGIRSHHSFIPLSENELAMRRISSDDMFTKMAVIDIDAAAGAAVPIATYQPGQYVACIYDQDWYIGNVVEIAEEHDDVLVTFMTRRVSTLSWPPETRKDECWIPTQHIICHIDAPELQGRGARSYTLSAVDYDTVQRLLPTFLNGATQ